MLKCSTVASNMDRCSHLFKLCDVVRHRDGGARVSELTLGRPQQKLPRHDAPAVELVNPTAGRMTTLETRSSCNGFALLLDEVAWCKPTVGAALKQPQEMALCMSDFWQIVQTGDRGLQIELKSIACMRQVRLLQTNAPLRDLSTAGDCQYENPSGSIIRGLHTGSTSMVFTKAIGRSR